MEMVYIYFREYMAICQKAHSKPQDKHVLLSGIPILPKCFLVFSLAINETFLYKIKYEYMGENAKFT